MQHTKIPLFVHSLFYSIVHNPNRKLDLTFLVKAVINLGQKGMVLGCLEDSTLTKTRLQISRNLKFHGTVLNKFREEIFLFIHCQLKYVPIVGVLTHLSFFILPIVLLLNFCSLAAMPFTVSPQNPGPCLVTIVAFVGVAIVSRSRYCRHPISRGEHYLLQGKSQSKTMKQRNY